jgi:hypothetical protein
VIVAGSFPVAVFRFTPPADLVIELSNIPSRSVFMMRCVAYVGAGSWLCGNARPTGIQGGFGEVLAMP